MNKYNGYRRKKRRERKKETMVVLFYLTSKCIDVLVFTFIFIG
jgi:hypothetical protein